MPQAQLPISQGQVIFAIIFAISFTIIVIIAYKKDARLHNRHYKGSLWVLLAFISFIAIIATIKYVFI
tara:strand:+ start:484 stop:687 length:204 start_codon:yes stop_codon:yes gene_type:complete